MTWRRSALRVASTSAALCLALAMSATSEAQSAATPSPSPSFTATLAASRTSLRIAERLEATLTLVGSEDVATARPAIGLRVGDFEVRSITPRGLGRLFGRAPREWQIVLITFETGARSLEKVAIEGTTPDGRAFVSSPAPAVQIEVSAPTVSADDPLQPPDPALGAAAGAAALTWLARSLLIAGALLLAWAFGRPAWERTHARLERTWRWQRLHRTLDDVRRRAATDPAAARAHCATVVTVLRAGSQYAAGRGLADLSTTELVDAVASTPNGRALAPELAPVLGELDTMRFAGRSIDAAVLSQSVDRARRVLQLAEAATRVEERRAS